MIKNYSTHRAGGGNNSVILLSPYHKCQSLGLRFTIQTQHSRLTIIYSHYNGVRVHKSNPRKDSDILAEMVDPLLVLSVHHVGLRCVEHLVTHSRHCKKGIDIKNIFFASDTVNSSTC